MKQQTNWQNEREIQKIYKEVYKKIFNKARLKAASEADKKAIQNAVLRLQNSKEYEQFCKEFAAKLAKKGLNQQRGIWKKYFEAAKASHNVAITASYPDYEKKLMAAAIRENFKMIKSIPEEMMKLYEHKYVKQLISQVAYGTASRSSFERMLKSHAVKNAKVIARTEAAKLQTSITRSRATEIGSVAYIWKSTKDKRTRHSHQDMNNVVVFWRDKLEEKPLLDNMYGDAGEFPNCRCDPSPIFDERDLKNPAYKVYDYTRHQIRQMPTSILLQYLEQGGL